MRPGTSGRARGGAGRAGRRGGTAARPRRRGLHRPARRQRHRAGGVAQRRGGGARPAGRVCVKVTGQVRSRPAGNENPELPTGAIEVVAEALEVLSRGRPAAVPGRGDFRGQRGRPRTTPGTSTSAARRCRGRCGSGRPLLPAVRRDARPRLRQRGDAVPDPVHARGRARLPGAGPAPAGQLVRAAAVAAAVQAAADGRRPRALLPARPLLPRRGLRARTGSRSSPRSTSRCRSSPART